MPRLIAATCFVSALLIVLPLANAAVIDFEDFSLAVDSYENGENLLGDFTSGGATFNNYFDTTWFSWEGWAYSNKSDLVDGSFLNQYSAYDPGNDGSNQFAVAFTGAFTLADVRITLPEGVNPVAADLTNVTYAALTMRDGDPNGFSRKFGTPPPENPEVPVGEWPDWLLLTITGLDEFGQPLSAPVEFYLADYRNLNGTPDYIVDQWTTVDLSSLAGARSLVFSHTGSDVGDFGLNTPAYVALDNLVVAPVPEPSTILLLASGAAVSVMAFRRFKPKAA